MTVFPDIVLPSALLKSKALMIFDILKKRWNASLLHQSVDIAMFGDLQRPPNGRKTSFFQVPDGNQDWCFHGNLKMKNGFFNCMGAMLPPAGSHGIVSWNLRQYPIVRHPEGYDLFPIMKICILNRQKVHR